jgi:hypothetical protein
MKIDRLDESENRTTTAPTRRIELWLQPTPGGRSYDDAVTRLAGLSLRGVIDEFAVETWGKGIDLSTDDLRDEHEQRVRERVSTFKQWAREHDTTIPDFEERRVVGEGRMGREYVVQSLPGALLAEFEGEEVVTVTPCTAGTDCITRRLDDLAEGDATFGIPDGRLTA